MGLKANLGRLETRLNCIELAGKLDTREEFIYYTERHTDQRELGGEKHNGKWKSCTRGYKPMTVEEIGERRNRAGTDAVQWMQSSCEI